LNVFCVMMDSWRRDHAGVYGNRRVKTPNLDRLARESTVFENAYAEGLPTLPVRMALFTGRYTFPFRGWQRLENNDIILADLLEREGYTTSLVADTPPMRQSNYMFGFEHVQWSPQWSFNPKRTAPWAPRARDVDISGYWKGSGGPQDQTLRERLQAYLEVRLLWRGEEDSYVAQTVKKAVRWLESLKGGDRDHIFLWLDSWDPHEPWDPPGPYDRMYVDPRYSGPKLILAPSGPIGYLTEEELQSIRDLYAGEVTMCDRWLGVFLDRVRELGLMENTLIIFLSDHGEPFGEHGILRKARPWPYEELTQIPLVIRHPEGFGRGERIKAFADTTDIMPTVLDFLGVEYRRPARPGAPPARARPRPPTSHEVMHGHSLLPLIRGEAVKVRDYAFSGHYQRSQAIQDHEWKYIQWGPVFSGKKEPELYNLQDDPGEQRSLYAEKPQVARRLEKELKGFMEGLPKPLPPQTTTGTELMTRVLR